MDGAVEDEGDGEERGGGHQGEGHVGEATPTSQPGKPVKQAWKSKFSRQQQEKLSS